MTWTAVAAVLWIFAALLLRGRAPRRSARLRLALVVAGVPLLGLLTYCFGPVLGLGALVLGAAVLALKAPSALRPSAKAGRASEGA